MAHYAELWGYWLEYDGRVVELDGHKYVIKVVTWRSYNNEALISVFAEPTVQTKKTVMYQEAKRKMGDDWSIDLLDSDCITSANVLVQLGHKWKETPADDYHRAIA